MNKYIHFVGEKGDKKEKGNEKKELEFERLKFPKSSLQSINIPENAKEFMMGKGIAYKENESFSLEISEHPLLDLSISFERKKKVYEDYYEIGYCNWGFLYIHKGGKIFSIPLDDYGMRQVVASDVEKFSKILEEFITINHGKEFGILDWSEEDCDRFESALRKVDPKILENSLWNTLLDEQRDEIDERNEARNKIKEDKLDLEEKLKSKYEQESRNYFKKDKATLLKKIKKWVETVEAIDKYRTENDFNVLFKLPEALEELKVMIDEEFTFENKQQFFDVYLKVLINFCDSIDEHANQEDTSISDQLSSLSAILAVLDLGFEIASDILLSYVYGDEREKYIPLHEKFKTAYSEIKFKRDGLFGYVNPFEFV